MLTGLRYRIFVVLLVCALGSALSVCPTDCLAAQAQRGTKATPCHGDGGARDHDGGFSVSCCIPAIAERAVQVPFDGTHVVAVDSGAAQQLFALDAATILPEVWRAPPHNSPPLFLFHHALLI